MARVEQAATATAAELAAGATGQVRTLGPDEVEMELKVIGAVLVDLREQEAGLDGTIPGAIAVPRGELELRADPTSPHHLEPLDPTRRIILHCADGDWSARAATTLQAMGYQQVAHLDGGFAAWRASGRPVETP
jgi:rhodanese-related sulfurtransferase